MVPIPTSTAMPIDAKKLPILLGSHLLFSSFGGLYLLSTGSSTPPTTTPQSSSQKRSDDMTPPKSPRRLLASRSKRMILSLVAFVAVNIFIIIKLHNEASHNLDSHIKTIDHSHLPPPSQHNNGQSKKGKKIFDRDTSKSGKSKGGGYC